MSEVKQIKGKQNNAASCIGNADQRLADARKLWIQEKGGTTTICAAFDTATMSVSANWESPFEGMTPGGVMSTAGAAGQALTGITTMTTKNTTQIWKGNQPVEIECELMFYALRDPVAEVMKPLHSLELLIAPDTSEGIIGFGSIQKPITLKIGKAAIYTDLILTSLSAPFDKETDSKGNFVRAKVNVNLRTKTMLNKKLLKKENGIRAS